MAQNPTHATNTWPTSEIDHDPLSESARGASPPGDPAKKAAAVARDRERRRVVTKSQAKLFIFRTSR